MLTNILRDPSLRLGWLYSSALKLGLNVALSFGLPINQIIGPQHFGDHGGTSEYIIVQQALIDSLVLQNKKNSKNPKFFRLDS